MDQILDTIQTEKTQFKYAGFGDRLVAAIIDSIILWVVNAIISPALVESLTAAFWSAKTRATLQMGRAKMTFAAFETVTYRVTAPLHPGAAKFYRTRGLAVTPAPD